MKPGDALIAALREHDVLDGADLRLVTWLRDHLSLMRDDDSRPDDGILGDAAGIMVEDFTLVVATLCRACGAGSLCLPLAPAALSAALSETLKETRESPDTAAPETLQDGRESASAPGPSVEENALAATTRFLQTLEQISLIGTPDAPRPLIRAHGNLYLHRYWSAARGVAKGLSEQATLPAPASSRLRDEILRETLVGNRLRAADGSPLDLTEGQEAALVAALSSSVFVLAGGPGTGKTTWTAAWLRAVLRIPGVDAGRVRLCAPTGRAAQRLTESLRATLAHNLDDARDAAAAGLQATTLHTLLGWRAFEGRFARGPEDPLDADWVLLDEASMADIFLLAALVRALKPGARLVLAGDPGQLPAVEAGAALGELLPEREGAPGPVPSLTLDVSHRAKGDIIPLATAIRRGQDDEVVRLLGSAFAASSPFEAFAPHGATLARLEPGDDAATDLQALLHAFATAAFTVAPDDTPAGAPASPGANAPERSRGGTTSGYTELLNRFRAAAREEEPALLNALWTVASRVRVLAPLRRGPVSAERANRILREHLEPVWRHARDAQGPGFHGAPILITRNDARTGLSNGDLGLWLEAGDGATVYFPRPGHVDGWFRLPVALLPECELGFATTVHKSQGSECDEVLVLLPEAGNRLLARETLYTAITRARKAARIYGSEGAVREATLRTLRRPGGVRELFPENSQG